MISFLESRETIASLSRDDIFGTRIYADFLSGSAELTWWDNENLLISLKSGVMTICGAVSDNEELLEFISVISPQALMCHFETAESLGLSVIQSGVIMAKSSAGESRPLDGYYPDVHFSEYHQLLERCEMAPDYAGFCLETSRSLKTGTGILLEHREENRLISALVATSVTDDSAIINAVAVDPDYQRKGLGSRLLYDAETVLPGRLLYIMREENKNEEFYRSCGYENIGRWCVAQI